MGDRGDHIRSYFDACTSGTPDDIAAHFTEDAVIWDTNHGPVRTAAGIGQFWSKIRAKWDGARWVVDSVVEDDDVAAIEWSMHGDNSGDAFVVRGSEHYDFRDDLIASIRQYWTFDADDPGSELVDYPYGTDAG